ncbi:hypothetical protein KAW65_00050 [candidate division WOR-3 bacterium]|nr:hypothetical protein [candidate division WOR-3 bacterium]
MEFKNKLRIFQTMYGVVMALALRAPIKDFFTLSGKIYRFHSGKLASIGFIHDWGCQLLPFAILVLTLFRFYYAVNNIEFYINKVNRNTERQRNKIAMWVIIDYIVLMFQGLLFYFLSGFVIIGRIENGIFSINHGQMLNFFKVYTFILYTNMVWLFLLLTRSKALKGSSPQLKWLINNLLFCVCFSLVILKHQIWSTTQLFWIGYGMAGLNTIFDLITAGEHYVFDNNSQNEKSNKTSKLKERRV